MRPDNPTVRAEAAAPQPSDSNRQELHTRDCLLTIEQTATFLRVSPTWVRRHQCELPIVRVGRLIRVDAALLLRQYSGTIHSGKPLNQASEERTRMIQRNQNGYVYKRGAAKIWYGRFREDIRMPDGTAKRRTRNVRLGTQAELPTRSSAIICLQKQMALQKPKLAMTFLDLHNRWQVAEVPTIKITTANYYQKILRAHILPVFGSRTITDITRENVQVFLAEQAPKYAKNTLRGMRVSLGRVLRWAVECGWLEKNPCANVRLPDAGVEQIVHKPLSSEQILAIAAKVADPYRALVRFLAVTGLRIGEAIGIKWSDFDADVLTVSRTIYEGRAQSPKTKRSVRSLPIPAALISELRQLGDGEFIFHSRAGTPVNPGNALKRYIRPAAQALGVQLDGWHAFRRGVATQLLRNGESAKLVSAILGNSIGTLLESYDLPQVENVRGVLAQVAETLLPNVTNPAPAN